MSVEIRLEAKGIFRKEVTLEDMTLGTLRYGVMDEFFRLDEGSLKGEWKAFYDPDHIGRGFETDWSPGCRDQVTLRLPLPATEWDIHWMFAAVRHIAKKWNLRDFTMDERTYSVHDIDLLKQEALDHTYAILESLRERIGEGRTYVMFCAMWPLYVNVSRLSEYGRNRDSEGFIRYLHDLQKQDLYYAVSHVYRSDSVGYFGVYAVTEGIDTILPLRPAVPLMMEDPASGEPLKAEFFAVNLGLKDMTNLGCIRYEGFAESVGLSTLPPYDEAHVILKGLSAEKIRAMREAYPDPLKENG